MPQQDRNSGKSSKLSRPNKHRLVYQSEISNYLEMEDNILPPVTPPCDQRQAVTMNLGYEGVNQSETSIVSVNQSEMSITQHVRVSGRSEQHLSFRTTQSSIVTSRHQHQVRIILHQYQPIRDQYSSTNQKQAITCYRQKH